MPATLIEHEEDPADRICRLAGDMNEFPIFNNQVLVGVYQRPSESKTSGGILLTHKTTDEDRYQSKVGLVLLLGPAAFIDENGKWFKDQDVGIGDWVVYRPSEGMSLTLVSKDESGKKQELLCRLIDDRAVRGKIESPMGPDRVY